MLDSPSACSESLQNLLADAAERLASVSDTPWLDAEVLLCHCLEKPRSFLRAWPERRPSPEQVVGFRVLLEQRLRGVPVAYLTGIREFWSREFIVDANVLIPRPDTELLIDLGLALLPAGKHCKIIDLGTGSGIIAVTLAAERPQAIVVATDLSPSALGIARRNAERHQVGNVRFIQSHWFDAISENDFDLVVSNPPYIADNDPHLSQGDVRFEPNSALVSAENGLRDIRLIAEQARDRLKNGGYLLIEHGYNQRAEVQAIFKALSYRQVETRADLAGNPRATTGLWNPT